MTRASKCFGWLGVAWTLSMTGTAQAVMPFQGGEYAIIGQMPGDQVHPQVALNTDGGFLVWEENTGANGTLMVLGVPLSRAFLGAGANAILPLSLGVEGDNQNAQTAMLATGGKVVVWQGGKAGFQKVYARFITPDNRFATTPIQVNVYTNNQQTEPVVTVLQDGNVFVAWNSYGQDGAMGGVFARRLSANGDFLGGEFQVNQTTAYNQRSPAAAVLGNGNLAVAWVSEQQRFPRSVDVYGRFLRPTGEPINNEFLLNNSTNICANPMIAPLANGGFTVVWSQQDLGAPTNGWDIYTRTFDASGKALAKAAIVNACTYGDQFAPKIAASGANQMVVWTSLLQDGSWEGVFGRILNDQGAVAGDEFQVNTTTLSSQMHPTVASNGAGQAVVVWTSFGLGANAFDLYAQVYGTAPTIEARLSLNSDAQGWHLEWSTQPGTSYQVQVSSNFDGWTNVGGPRTADGSTDSILLTPSAGAAYYRIVVLP